jgi:hypothetical protein
MNNDDLKKKEQNWGKFKFLMGVGIVIYFILIRVFNDLSGNYSNQSRVNIYVPWGIIAIFISFYIFREYDILKKSKRIQRMENLHIHRERLFSNWFKAMRRNSQTNT